MPDSTKPGKKSNTPVEPDLTEGEAPVGMVAESSPPPSTEVVLHELGQSIAVSVAAVQQELARYPNALGAYILDEVELHIPVCMRVDSLGQVLVTVLENETPERLVGQLHLKVRPVLGASQPPPVTSGQSLEALGALTPEEIARLQEQRIFSVDDLLRIARNAAGRNGLSKLNLQVGLGNLLDLASVLALPMLPAPVAESLLRIGVRSVGDFVQRDAAELARLLTGQLEQPIKPEDVLIWQQEVRKFIALPLPSRRASQHNGHR